MKMRCDNPKVKVYPHYGGRGITYDPRWADFTVFLSEMGAKPTGMTLERLDNEKGYCKANCAWVTNAEQQQNKRNNVKLEFNGLNLCLAEWGRRYGLAGETIAKRLKVGWTIADALTTPSRKAPKATRIIPISVPESPLSGKMP